MENKQSNQSRIIHLLYLFFALASPAYSNAASIQNLVHQENLPAYITMQTIGTQTLMEYTLSAMVTEQFNKAYEHLRIDPYKNWEHYKTQGLAMIKAQLPADLIEIIVNMRKKNFPTALIIHNAPTDTIIPITPRDGHRPPSPNQENGKGYISEAVIFGICSLLEAFPEFDEQERDGTVINQIIPRDEVVFRGQACSYGSDLEFGIHTENCYQEPPLKFFSLFCLRGDPKVDTNIVFLENILDWIKIKHPHPATLLEQLGKPLYLQKTGPSFRSSFRQVLSPILTTNENGERIFRFNTTYSRTEGTTPETKEAAEWLKEQITSDEFKAKHYTKVNLKRGDFLLFNNWEIMHGRDAFKIDPDNWRWLQRCYFMLNEHKNASIA